MPQPDNLFGSMAEYRAFLEKYEKTPYTNSGLTWQMGKTYHERLPVYLLARCPFCNGRVWEAIDTYSLNGPGWKHGGRHGYGWAGHDDWDRAGPGYHSDCHHIKIVICYLNLNGFQPDDVFGPVQISEVPCIMKWIIEIEGVSAVIHAIPVSRYDAAEPSPRYTAYFLSYFAPDDSFPAFEAVTDQFHAARAGLVGGPMDCDLTKWVKAGRLFWLDSDNASLPLRSAPSEAFPYANIQGLRYLEIYQGKVEFHEDPINKLLNFLRRFLR
jgi:hypothetical protein